MDEQLLFIAATSGLLLTTLIVTLLILRRAVVAVPSGSALVISSPSAEPKVRFERSVVIPIMHAAELVDITTKRVVLERTNPRGIRCQDGIRVHMRAVFLVRINPTEQDVNQARKRSSAASLASAEYVRELFADSFTQALESVAAKMDFDMLTREQERLKDHLMEVIGRDLDGFVLDDVSVTNIEMVPVSELDPEDTRDAEGIRKITEITGHERQRTAEINMQLRAAVAKLDLNEAEILLALEQQQVGFAREMKTRGGSGPDVQQLRAALDERVRRIVSLVQSPP